MPQKKLKFFLMKVTLKKMYQIMYQMKKRLVGYPF